MVGKGKEFVASEDVIKYIFMLHIDSFPYIVLKVDNSGFYILKQNGKHKKGTLKISRRQGYLYLYTSLTVKFVLFL